MSTNRKGVAAVTGAAQGIGRAIALRLAEDGFDVCVNDIPSNAEKLDALVQDIGNVGRASSAYPADVSVEEDVQKMVAQVVETHGSLDVMVANAGICPWFTLADISVEEWDRLMAVNVRSMFLCYRHAAAQMVVQGNGGRLIGACSASGKRPANKFMGAYCASKFAVRGLTQAAALEFGPHKITVNAYAPGPVDTDMLRFLEDSNTTSSGGSLTERMKATIPLGRVATTEDVANLVSFIASEKSSFITGQSLSVNGGIFMD
ncbi:hypothetical protein MKEN_00494700 [Mycena kentingensis (nom. inval.)]|nr:hypothetical protein MKEN_00494700 [Mycena kentingensis (nom. inval.)]